jgi:hypothetical protein
LYSIFAGCLSVCLCRKSRYNNNNMDRSLDEILEERQVR